MNRISLKSTLVTTLFLVLAGVVSAGKPASKGEPAPRPGAEHTPAATPSPDSAPDSMALALATTWAQYLRPSLVKSYGDSNTVAMTNYVEGVRTAFTTEPSREPFYRGVLEGMQLAVRLAQLQQMGINVTLTDFNRYLLDCLVTGHSPMTNEEANNLINEAIARATSVPPLSLEDEQRYLDTQFKREGVVKMENGLLIEVLREGEGKYPAPDDRVVVSYTGRLSDGTVFDHTDRPVTFNVDKLVPGMTEGLLQMKPGGRYRLIIPPSLGYGAEGIHGVIPGNAVLDFDIELLQVLPSQNE